MGQGRRRKGLLEAAGETLVKRELSNEGRFRDLMRYIVPYMMRRSSLISFNTPQPTAGARNGMERNTAGIRGASDSSRRPFQFLAAAMSQGVLEKRRKEEEQHRCWFVMRGRGGGMYISDTVASARCTWPWNIRESRSTASTPLYRLLCALASPFLPIANSADHVQNTPL